MKQLGFLILIFFLNSCNEKVEKKIYNIPPPPSVLNRNYQFSESEIKNSINGIYSTPVNGSVGEAIALYKDSFYEFRSGACLYTSYDSGYYKIRSDTLFFQTVINVSDSNRDSHNQIQHLNYALLIDNKIIFNSGLKESENILFKYKVGFNNHNFLDQDGNGESYKLDTLNRTYEEGEYKNFILYNGWTKNFYNADDLIGKRDYYKNGILDTSRN